MSKPCILCGVSVPIPTHSDGYYVSICPPCDQVPDDDEPDPIPYEVDHGPRDWSGNGGW